MVKFELGMITGMSTAAAFYTSGYKPIFEVNLHWGIYVAFSLICLLVFIIIEVKGK